MTDKLKPCPCCYSTDIVDWSKNTDHFYGCECQKCGLTAKSAEAWNTRADDWQPIETAPKDEWILIATPQHDAGMTTSMWDSEVEWWMIDDGKNPELWLRGDAPTHWKPLPQPPKENE